MAQDVPFVPTETDDQLEQPTLARVLELAVQEGARQLRVSLPCRVVRVRGDQLVDLQPLLQVKYKALAQPTTLPVLPHCPVLMPRGQNYAIRLPVAEGDTGLAVFADRSLDNWLSSGGGVVDPESARTHNITDAIFVPGLVPLAQQTQEPNDDLVLQNGASQVRLSRGGQVVLKNAQAHELVDLVQQLTDLTATLHQTLQSALVNTLMGPMPFLGATQAKLAQQLAQAQAISQYLGTLKG